MTMQDLIKQLPGPIAVIGAGGFIGGNVCRILKEARDDICAVMNGYAPFLYQMKIRTVFNLSTTMPIKPLKEWVFIHAGSSEYYGKNCDAPAEQGHYAQVNTYGAFKAAQYGMLQICAREEVPCCELRLYHAYGPGDKTHRLLPTLIREAKEGRLPPLGNPDTTYDYIHVDDIARAFVLAALNLKPENYGEAFNIGTGRAISLREIVTLTCDIFNIKEEPQWNTYKGGTFYEKPWRANTEKSEKLLNFKAEIGFEEGFRRICESV